MSNNRIVVACSGAANLGQIANSVAVKMQQRGTGQMSCLAALAANVDSYVKSARESELVVIDGCSVGCGKTVVDNLEGINYSYFDLSQILTDVQKAKQYDQIEDCAEKAYSEIMKAL